MVRLKKDSVFYSTLLFAAEGVALQVMGFVYRIALSRLIGAEGMGVYGIVMPFYSVINSFAISGLALAVTKESAKNKGDVRRYIKAGKNLFFMLFLLCAGTVVLFRGAIAEKLLGDVRTAPALLMLLPCLFLTGIENIYKAYFQGSKNIVPALVSELAEQAVRIAAVVVILSAVPQRGAQTSVMLIVAGMIISELFSSVFLSAIFRFSAPAPPLSPESGIAVGTAVFKAAMPVSLAALLNNIIAGANAVILPRRLIGAGMEKAEALSEFGILTGMTIPFLMMPAALIFPITSVMVPRLARAVFENRGDTVKRKCAKAFHVTGIISGGAACLMLTLGGDIAPALYGEPEAGRFIAPLPLPPC